METKTLPDVLQGYVDRGLLRNFHPVGDRGDFGFTWLNHKPMHLQWKSSGRTLVFKDVAPNIAARSIQYRELRAFLMERAEAELPDHRRVDRGEFEILCQNRKGQVSIGLRLASGTEEEAMSKLMLVIHEAFLFLHERWPDYMHEEFGSSLE